MSQYNAPFDHDVGDEEAAQDEEEHHSAFSACDLHISL
jgi:hypothetical protein